MPLKAATNTMDSVIPHLRHVVAPISVFWALLAGAILVTTATNPWPAEGETWWRGEGKGIAELRLTPLGQAAYRERCDICDWSAVERGTWKRDRDRLLLTPSSGRGKMPLELFAQTMDGCVYLAEAARLSSLVPFDSHSLFKSDAQSC